MNLLRKNMNERAIIVAYHSDVKLTDERVLDN